MATNEEIRLWCIERFRQIKEDFKEREIRKECNNFFQNLDKENSLLKQTVANIEKKFDKLEMILLNIPRELEERLEEKFTTKLEFQPIKEKANKHDKVFLWLYTIVFWAIIAALIKLIIV